MRVNPTFWGWVFQFGNLMRILAPTTVVEQYANHLSKSQSPQLPSAAQDDTLSYY